MSQTMTTKKSDAASDELVKQKADGILRRMLSTPPPKLEPKQKTEKAKPVKK